MLGIDRVSIADCGSISIHSPHKQFMMDFSGIVIAGSFIAIMYESWTNHPGIEETKKGSI